MLMALVQVVLTWSTSTFCQTSIYKPIGFKFGMSDYVPEYTNPAKFGFDRISGGGSR
jgi:hypothetical protein